MRFSDFDLRPEKIALKVKKNMKIGPWFFSDFLTFGAIFSGPRLKSTNRIGHVNCIVLNSRMIPHMTKLIDWFDLWGWWLHVLVPPHLIFWSTLYIINIPHLSVFYSTHVGTLWFSVRAPLAFSNIVSISILFDVSARCRFPLNIASSMTTCLFHSFLQLVNYILWV